MNDIAILFNRLSNRARRQPFVLLAVVAVLLSFCLQGGGDEGLRQILQERQYDQITGKVEKKIQKETTTQIYLSHLSVEGQSQTDPIPVKFQLIVILKEQTQECLIGQTIRVSGKYAAMEAPSNPGAFDARSFYERQNIGGYLFQGKLLETGMKYDSLRETLWRVREQSSQMLHACVGEDLAQILDAMLLGKKEALDQDWKDQMEAGGISHVLAISGLHISLIGAALYEGLRKLCLSRKAAAGLSGTTIVLYLLMTGGGISAKRAVLMYAVWLLAEILGRTRDIPTALSISVIFLMIQQPQMAGDSGFLMSVLAIVGIGCLRPLVIEDTKTERKRSVGKRIQDSFWTAFALQLALLPVLLHTYYGISAAGPLLNMMILPLAPILLGSGITGVFAGWLTGMPQVVRICLLPAKLTWWLWERLLEVTSRIPGSFYITGEPEGWQYVLFFLGLGAGICLLIVNWKKTGKLFWVAAFVILLLPVEITRHDWCKKDQISFTFLNIGQGDGTVIQSGMGKTMLIDGGSTTESSPGRYILRPYLRYMGIRILDQVIISHFDSDHVNGIIELLQHPEWGIRIRKIIISPHQQDSENHQLVLELASQQNIPILTMKAGDYFVWEGARVQCLQPYEDFMLEDDNEQSLVIEVDLGIQEALFTGDIGKEGEANFLSHQPAVQTIELLKTAHHGSKNSSTEAFLQWCHPQTAVISVGSNNTYGHPAAEALERLRAVTDKIYRTDQLGIIRQTLQLDP